MPTCDATAAVRTFTVRAASACPWWCERDHPGYNTMHMADIGEVRNTSGYTVQITIVQHEESGHAVRVFTCMGEQTTTCDLAPGAAEALGSSIVALSPNGAGRAYGQALQRAAAHLLPPEGEEDPSRRPGPQVRLVENTGPQPAPDENPSPATLFRFGFLAGYMKAAKNSPRRREHARHQREPGSTGRSTRNQVSPGTGSTRISP